MTPKKASIFLLWYGEKAIAGDEPTEEEFEMFKEARKVSLGLLRIAMGIKPEHYAYTKGKGFQEV